MDNDLPIDVPEEYLTMDFGWDVYNNWFKFIENNDDNIKTVNEVISNYKHEKLIDW